MGVSSGFATAQPLRHPEGGWAYFQAPDQHTDGRHLGAGAMGNGSGGDEGHVQTPEVDGRHSRSADEKAAGDQSCICIILNMIQVLIWTSRRGRPKEV
ncbi:hypothetical protein CO665_17360 [Rhizobium anhuiense]|uniref:Uncharacterized protein n=1 Tax=Rhizobium anhuiense TaxID=1184720 RepID=A0A3S0QA97_9HYPH|nr:hypothetical protein AS890_07150 [Rhizobium anhuiense bv. trifolii]PDS36778.1 hypothetical protein CO665_17360 [Rhizobium anhuiense]RUM00313.1 hypothetical protein EEQ99_18380 [Rhizobium anhuiense]